MDRISKTGFGICKKNVVVLEFHDLFVSVRIILESNKFRNNTIFYKIYFKSEDKNFSLELLVLAMIFAERKKMNQVILESLSLIDWFLP